MERAKHPKVKPKAASQYEDMVEEKMLTHRYSADPEETMMSHRFSADSPPPIPPPPVPPPPFAESLDRTFSRNDDCCFDNVVDVNDVVDIDAKFYYDEALINSEPPFNDNFVPEVKITEVISPPEILNPNIIQKESVSPFEVFNKKPSRLNQETKSKPASTFTPILQKEEIKDVAKCSEKSEEKIPDGIVKNAKSSLQKDTEKVLVKKPVEIEEELKGIDAGKVKKTASAYLETKDKSESKTVPPSRKIAQLFKAEFR
jgi:hypothetical protein